jgi:hypothetical protein
LRKKSLNSKLHQRSNYILPHPASFVNIKTKPPQKYYMDFKQKLDNIFFGTICEGVLGKHFFSDLKKIYQAHAARKQPDRMVLNRTANTMISFLSKEIERTNSMLDPGWSDKHDAELNDEAREILSGLIGEYEEAYDKLKDAYRNADYVEMSIWIDTAINLEHNWGSVWDNLQAYATDDIGEEDAGTKHDELTDFMRSIGRFPRIKPGLSYEDTMKEIKRAKGWFREKLG